MWPIWPLVKVKKQSERQGSVIFYRDGEGDQVLFLRSKGGSKDFFKSGSLIFFKEIKYFVKHFRTQMEFLLILQKRCSFESVSCWNSSEQGQELQFAYGGYVQIFMYMDKSDYAAQHPKLQRKHPL